MTLEIPIKYGNTYLRVESLQRDINEKIYYFQLYHDFNCTNKLSNEECRIFYVKYCGCTMSDFILKNKNKYFKGIKLTEILFDDSPNFCSIEDLVKFVIIMNRVFSYKEIYDRVLK